MGWGRVNSRRAVAKAPNHVGAPHRCGTGTTVVRHHSETPEETGERAAGDWGRRVQCVGRTSIIHLANTTEGGGAEFGVARGDASTTESLIIAVVCHRRPRRSGPETLFDDLPGVVRLRAR